MSSLLERAIIDATALKEAALKNAENLVIEKYSDEVKTAMTQLLEQEEELGGLEDLGDTPSEPVAPGEDPEDAKAEEFRDSTVGQIPDGHDPDLGDPEDEIIDIKLSSLRADLPDEEDGVFGGDDDLDDGEIGIDISDDFEDDADFDADLDADTDFGTEAADTDFSADVSPETLSEMLEELEIENDEGMIPEFEEEHEVQLTLEDEELLEDDDFFLEEDMDELEEELNNIEEAVRVDFEPQKSGWAGTPESLMREYESMLLAREQDSEVKEENKELRKTVAALQKENKNLSSIATKLQSQMEKYSSTLETLQEKLESTNVSNAKLLYINRALENASLNERQKEKLVESISKATTIQEAKIIFDTLQETVTSSPAEKRMGSLNEAVSRRSTLLVGARKEQKQGSANPAFDRLQKLAGIKK
mgnify:CR=1 FL=1